MTIDHTPVTQKGSQFELSSSIPYASMFPLMRRSYNIRGQHVGTKFNVQGGENKHTHHVKKQKQFRLWEIRISFRKPQPFNEVEPLVGRSHTKELTLHKVALYLTLWTGAIPFKTSFGFGGDWVNYVTLSSSQNTHNFYPQFCSAFWFQSVMLELLFGQLFFSGYCLLPVLPSTS